MRIISVFSERTRGGLFGAVAVFGVTVLLTNQGFGREVERVPGITVSSAEAKIVVPRSPGDGKEYKETVSETNAADRGTLQFRASLQGGVAALSLLKRPGILPITHEVTTYGGLRERVIEVQQVGLHKKTVPGWRLWYVGEILQPELKTQGYFRTSALSQTSLEKPARLYKIRFVTNDGGLLADANGRPICAIVHTPEFEP